MPTSLVASACANSLTTSSGAAITDSRMVELSGIVASRAQANVLWVHNDSGDSNRIFAIDSAGVTLSTFTIAGANAIDWEDIGIGPGPSPGVDYLYVADVGDNLSTRSEVQVYRFAEPTVPATNTTVSVSGVETIRLQYPGGARDSEALIVDPRNGSLTLIEKKISGGTVGIYRAPANLASGSLTTMSKVGSLKLPGGLFGAVTAADMSSDATTLAIRTYGDLRLYQMLGPSAPVQVAFLTTPCIVAGPAELQGEAIAFNSAGNQLITVSEGASQPLHFFAA